MFYEQITRPKPTYLSVCWIGLGLKENLRDLNQPEQKIIDYVG